MIFTASTIKCQISGVGNEYIAQKATCKKCKLIGNYLCFKV